MGLWDDFVKGNVVTGLAIGIGAAVLAPVVVPIVASVAKPLTKAAIKGGLALYESGKETVTEVGEILEDLVAEAQAELTEERKAAVAAAVEGEGKA